MIQLTLSSRSRANRLENKQQRPDHQSPPSLFPEVVLHVFVIRVFLKILPDLFFVIGVQAKPAHNSPDLMNILSFFEKPFQETVSSQHPSNQHHSSPFFLDLVTAT